MSLKLTAALNNLPEGDGWDEAEVQQRGREGHKQVNNIDAEDVSMHLQSKKLVIHYLENL